MALTSIKEMPLRVVTLKGTNANLVNKYPASWQNGNALLHIAANSLCHVILEQTCIVLHKE